MPDKGGLWVRDCIKPYDPNLFKTMKPIDLFLSLIQPTFTSEESSTMKHLTCKLQSMKLTRQA